MKRSIFLAGMLTLAAGMFTGCMLDNEEPAGVEAMRTAKAEYFSAEATLKLAEAAYKDAQTAMEYARVEQQELENEALALKNMKLEAETLADIEEINLELAALVEKFNIRMVELAEQLAKAEADYAEAMLDIEINMATLDATVLEKIVEVDNSIAMYMTSYNQTMTDYLALAAELAEISIETEVKEELYASRLSDALADAKEDVDNTNAMIVTYTTIIEGIESDLTATAESLMTEMTDSLASFNLANETAITAYNTELTTKIEGFEAYQTLKETYGDLEKALFDQDQLDREELEADAVVLKNPDTEAEDYDGTPSWVTAYTATSNEIDNDYIVNAFIRKMYADQIVWAESALDKMIVFLEIYGLKLLEVEGVSENIYAFDEESEFDGKFTFGIDAYEITEDGVILADGVTEKTWLDLREEDSTVAQFITSLRETVAYLTTLSGDVDEDAETAYLETLALLEEAIEAFFPLQAAYDAITEEIDGTEDVVGLQETYDDAVKAVEAIEAAIDALYTEKFPTSADYIAYLKDQYDAYGTYTTDPSLFDEVAAAKKEYEDAISTYVGTSSTEAATSDDSEALLYAQYYYWSNLAAYYASNGTEPNETLFQTSSSTATAIYLEIMSYGGAGFTDEENEGTLYQDWQDLSEYRNDIKVLYEELELDDTDWETSAYADVDTTELDADLKVAEGVEENAYKALETALETQKKALSDLYAARNSVNDLGQELYGTPTWGDEYGEGFFFTVVTDEDTYTLPAYTAEDLAAMVTYTAWTGDDSAFDMHGKNLYRGYFNYLVASEIGYDDIDSLITQLEEIALAEAEEYYLALQVAAEYAIIALEDAIEVLDTELSEALAANKTAYEAAYEALLEEYDVDKFMPSHEDYRVYTELVATTSDAVSTTGEIVTTYSFSTKDIEVMVRGDKYLSYLADAYNSVIRELEVAAYTKILDDLADDLDGLTVTYNDALIEYNTYLANGMVDESGDYYDITVANYEAQLEVLKTRYEGYATIIESLQSQRTALLALIEE